MLNLKVMLSSKMKSNIFNSISKMKVICLLLALAAFATGAPKLSFSGKSKVVQAVKLAPNNATQRIRGGKIVDGSEFTFPYAVSLQAKGVKGVFCGGVILNSDWILTAAHCFDSAKPTQEISILAGTFDATVYEGPTVQFIKAEKWFVHPSYDTDDFSEGDIALVKLSKPLVMNRRVQAVNLPTATHNFEGQGIVAGWGAIFNNQVETSKDLKMAHFLTTDIDLCKRAYEGFEGTNAACVIGKGPDAACAGDSGSSFVQEDPKTQTLAAIGVLSFGSDYCGSGPMIFTKVQSYLGWLKVTMGQ